MALALAPAKPQGGDAVVALKKFLQEEWRNEAKFKANLRLLRGLAIFGGSVFIFRNFGEALFAL